MAGPHHHHAHSHATGLTPGWSLLRLSAATRLGIAGVLAAVLWGATLLVIG